MALVNLGDDPWLLEYESCDKLQREIMEQLCSREKLSRTSEQYLRISSSIRMRLKQFTTEVEQLRIKLDQESKSSFITFEEKERRYRQIEVLQSKYIKMHKAFESNINDINFDRDRSNLLGQNSEMNSVQDLGTANWGVEEAVTSNINDQSIESIRIQQKRIVQEQEKGLEELSKIISRQKNIAQTITNEVDLHNEILDDIGNHIDQTDIRVRNETQNVRIVSRRDKTWGYWVVIIILFIAIITVFAI